MPLRVYFRNPEKTQNTYHIISSPNYDGYMYNGKDIVGEAFIRNPKQIKSAYAITYDDNGNIIPISQRDNFLINDIRYKQGGKMNILEFLKNGSGIHIKEENKGKFTSYCGGKVTNECIQKGKNSSNPAIRKRATFAANARKWKHEKGGEIITKAQQGSQLPTAEDAAKRYKNGDFIKEIQDNNEGHSVIQGVMTNKPFHNQGSIVRKINYRMGIPVDTTYIETPPSLLPVKKVSRVATRYSNQKDNAYAGNQRQLYKTLSNRYKTAMEVMRRKEGGVLKAQLGLGLTQFNDSQNPNAVGGDIVNSYLRNQLMIPYLNKQKEDYKKWKLQMKQQANTQKSSLLDNVVNTGLSFGVDYLKNKFGI